MSFLNDVCTQKKEESCGLYLKLHQVTQHEYDEICQILEVLIEPQSVRESFTCLESLVIDLV